MFKPLEGDIAILYSKGVYRQVPLFVRNDATLFAAVGKDRFVRLSATGSTSQADVKLDALVYDGPLFQDKLGRLAVKGGASYKPVAQEKAAALIASSEGD